MKTTRIADSDTGTFDAVPSLAAYMCRAPRKHHPEPMAHFLFSSAFAAAAATVVAPPPPSPAPLAPPAPQPGPDPPPNGPWPFKADVTVPELPLPASTLPLGSPRAPFLRAPADALLLPVPELFETSGDSRLGVKVAWSSVKFHVAKTSCQRKGDCRLLRGSEAHRPVRLHVSTGRGAAGSFPCCLVNHARQCLHMKSPASHACAPFAFIERSIDKITLHHLDGNMWQASPSYLRGCKMSRCVASS